MKSYNLLYVKKVLNDFAVLNDLPKVDEEYFSRLNDEEVKIDYLMQYKKEMLFNLNIRKNVLIVSIELLERLI